MGPFIKPKERILDHDEPEPITEYHQAVPWIGRGPITCATCGWSTPRNGTRALYWWRLHRSVSTPAWGEDELF